VVSYWGAPALPQTALGKRSPRRAARRLMQAVRRYALTGERPVVPAIDLVVTLATRDRGRRGKYSARLTRRVIRRYLDAARRIGGRLIIDIQPGRSSLLRELKWHRRWLLEPDVDVAFDPEWNVGRRGVPGQTTGYVRAKTINASSAWLADLVRANGLPQKALIVHHFRDGSITRRPELVQPGAPVALTLNFDGIGSPAATAPGSSPVRRAASSATTSCSWRSTTSRSLTAAGTAGSPDRGTQLHVAIYRNRPVATCRSAPQSLAPSFVSSSISRWKSAAASKCL